ncbi:hypothetical protein [Brucella intermedia]|uniref:hypothetical protein n=1 Tax=Brucella intermedia TaxID=94625 RepID=UPI0023630637|nr:hypothetical protein [Brucella intermedia]
MAEIISLERARDAQRCLSRRNSAFWRIVNDQLRADLSRKQELLISFGNPSVNLREVASDAEHGGDHIMILFSGAGQLKGFSYAFVVHDEPENNALSAEILVIDNAMGTLLSKKIGWCLTKNYSRRWLNESYSAALDIIAPPSVSKKSTSAVRA